MACTRCPRIGGKPDTGRSGLLPGLFAAWLVQSIDCAAQCYWLIQLGVHGLLVCPLYPPPPGLAMGGLHLVSLTGCHCRLQAAGKRNSDNSLHEVVH